MVFWCLDPPQAYMPVDSKNLNDYSKANLLTEKASSTWDVYPGSRRNVLLSDTTKGDKNLVRTGGNALMKYDEDTMKDLVRVTIPENVRSGQLIQVNTSDGRMAYFMVPFLAKTGSEYLIKFPSIETAVITNQRKTNNYSENKLPKNDTKCATIVKGQDIDHNKCYDERTAPVVVSSVEVEYPISSFENDSSRLSNGNPNIMDSLILVCVPPGVAPGTQLDVICHENNEKINVTVPPGGVSQFYVARPRMNLSAPIDCQSKHIDDYPVAKQNWNNHPSAYAIPMIAGSFLY